MANYDLTYEGSRVQGILDTGDELRDAGYIFRGEATPSTVPGTPTERVAYIGGPGTYTNFGDSITVPAGCVCIFKYTGSAWTNQVIDAQGASEGIFDLSAYNAQGGTLATYADLSAALAALNALPADFKKGGMSLKFVLSSDNKYVQFRLMSDTFNTTPANWQEAADKEALSLLSTPVIGEYNITDYATKNTSGNTVITTPKNYNVMQKTLDVQGGEQFVIFGAGAETYRLWAFTDDNNNILSKADGMEDTRESGALIIAPENATKLVITSYISYIADFALFGKGIIVKLFEGIETLENDVETLEAVINGETRQIPTDSKFYAKYDISGDVVTETSPNHNVWQLIVDVIPQQIVTIYGYGGEAYRLWAFTDDGGNIISKCEGSVDASTTPQVVEVPQGVTKLYVSCYDTYVSALNVSIATKSLENKILGEVNILDGKKLYFIGDSIMIGQPEVPDIKNITLHISNDYHCECVNNALGGSLFLYPWYISNIYSIYYQLTQIPNDADYIIIQGGVNGVNLTDPTQPNYAPMGEITSYFDADVFDKTTQIGCLEAICQYLHEHFAGKRVGFIMTYQIGTYQYWIEKATLFEQVLKKWSIPILDWRESGISLASPNLASKWGIDTFANYDNYDTNAGYSIDDRVIYDNKAYKAEENIAAPAGAFDVSKWTLISSQRYDNWHCNGLAYKMLAHKTAEWLKTL